MQRCQGQGSLAGESGLESAPSTAQNCFTHTNPWGWNAAWKRVGPRPGGGWDSAGGQWDPSPEEGGTRPGGGGTQLADGGLTHKLPPS